MATEPVGAVRTETHGLLFGSSELAVCALPRNRSTRILRVLALPLLVLAILLPLHLSLVLLIALASIWILGWIFAQEGIPFDDLTRLPRNVAVSSSKKNFTLKYEQIARLEIGKEKIRVHTKDGRVHSFHACQEELVNCARLTRSRIPDTSVFQCR